MNGYYMTCSLFVDYSRLCIQNFPQMYKYTNYEKCKSDDFKDCFHYIVFNSKFKCKYMTKCATYLDDKTPDFLKKIFNDEKLFPIVKEITLNYCLSEANCKNCEMFKKYESGEKSPIPVFPDGKTHLLDMLFKKKIKIK